MQFFTRGIDESIVIGDVIVRVVSIDDDQVRLGISSPHAEPRYREITLTRNAADEAASVCLSDLLQSAHA